MAIFHLDPNDWVVEGYNEDGIRYEQLTYTGRRKVAYTFPSYLNRETTVKKCIIDKYTPETGYVQLDDGERTFNLFIIWDNNMTQTVIEQADSNTDYYEISGDEVITVNNLPEGYVLKADTYTMMGTDLKYEIWNPDYNFAGKKPIDLIRSGDPNISIYFGEYTRIVHNPVLVDEDEDIYATDPIGDYLHPQVYFGEGNPFEPEEASVSKVEYFGKVLLDLTGDTVSPASLLKGFTAHDMTGKQIVGIAESGSDESPNLDTVNVAPDLLLSMDLHDNPLKKRYTPRSYDLDGFDNVLVNNCICLFEKDSDGSYSANIQSDFDLIPE